VESAAADAPASSPEAVAAAELKVRTGLAQDKFDSLDANHDGFVDRQEAAKSNVLKTLFNRFDVDKNGKLSLTEFAAINDLAAIKPNEQTAKRDLQ
jgi:Ca2+-binding EF-hand superfamily protein